MEGPARSYLRGMSADEPDSAPRYRQKDVLALLALGFGVEESSRVLEVSTSTIEHERSALRRAFGARTPPHLVAIAYESGILPLERSRLERLQALIRRHLPQASDNASALPVPFGAAAATRPSQSNPP